LNSLEYARANSLDIFKIKLHWWRWCRQPSDWKRFFTFK